MIGFLSKWIEGIALTVIIASAAAIPAVRTRVVIWEALCYD